MHSIKLTIIIAAIALCVFACNNTSNTTDKTSNAPLQQTANNSSEAANKTNAASTDELAQAREIYGATCTKCHGANADGGHVEFDNVKLNVPSLRQGRARTHTDERLTRQINNGGEGMPAFKDKLTPEKINALIHLIRQEFQGQNATQTSVSVAPKS